MTIFRTFTDAERAALKLHRLDTDRPSQLSDAFVLGMRAAAGAEPSQEQNDGFNGDTPHLVNCMRALVNLDEAGALAPHGIGGHARTLLLAAAARLERATDVDPAIERSRERAAGPAGDPR